MAQCGHLRAAAKVSSRAEVSSEGSTGEDSSPSSRPRSKFSSLRIIELKVSVPCHGGLSTGSLDLSKCARQ